MTFGKALHRAGMLAGLILLLNGCGNESPLQPTNTSGGAATGPEILVVSRDGSTRWTQPGPVPTTEEGAEPVVTSRGLKVSAAIDGSVGGRLRCGRFVLAIPAGAFDGTGTVSMTMPDTTVMIVDLAISPIELNAFNQKVRLCLITTKLDVAADDLSLYYFDPKYEAWKALGCDKDLSDDEEVTGESGSLGLLTDLDHFSRYSGGKAGW